MVAKHCSGVRAFAISLNLAKIHMVAKPSVKALCIVDCPNLAKIHMVAKQKCSKYSNIKSPNLAKIHMVAKRIQLSMNYQ